MKKCILSRISILAGFGSFMLLSLPGCSDKPVAQPQTEYDTMTIALSDVETVEKFPATIAGRRDVDIYYDL